MLSTSSGTPAAESDILDPELLRATSRSLNDALALSDMHGIVLAVNAAYSKLYGFPEPEVVGRSFAVIFPEDERVAAEITYRHVFHGDAPPVYRASVRRADGADRHVESRITFVQRRDTRVAMLSVIRDITAPPTAGLIDRPLPTKLEMQGLESLYNAHARSCVGYAHALLGDVAQAESVVEDALLATWRAGVADEQNNSAARLLLFSVLRRSASEVLLNRVRARLAPRELPNQGHPVPRWWAKLPH